MTGARKNVKIYGCVEIYRLQLLYQRASVFNTETYLDFLERIARYYYPQVIYYIQDNASYHKDDFVWEWFTANQSWWRVYNLPEYSPELNAAERIWHHVRMKATHNRYFADEGELLSTVTGAFRSIQRKPNQIQGYMRSFL